MNAFTGTWNSLAEELRRSLENVSNGIPDALLHPSLMNKLEETSVHLGQLQPDPDRRHEREADVDVSMAWLSGAINPDTRNLWQSALGPRCLQRGSS